MTATITQLISYPIKSCAGIKHQQTNINHMGLVGDRQMMLVDENGVFLSQRKYPQMALIQPTMTTNGWRVKAPNMPALHINDCAQNKQPISVTIWRDDLQAQSYEANIDNWFSDYLNQPVRLVKYGQKSHRQIDPNYAKNDEAVAFADGFPLLVTHEATLKQLNQHLHQPVVMERFRPNIVVSSDMAAWDELHWQQLSDQQLLLNLVKPCSRCVMTGVEQNTGEKTGTEVLKTLRQRFAYNDKAIFGINTMAAHSEPIKISIGQQLTVFRTS